MLYILIKGKIDHRILYWIYYINLELEQADNFLDIVAGLKLRDSEVIKYGFGNESDPVTSIIRKYANDLSGIYI